MSSRDMSRRDLVYTVKVGSRKTLTFNMKDANGAILDLTDTTTYSTGVLKVWKPDGTLLINGAIVFSNRAGGVVTYALGAGDAVIANSGVWVGEIELKNTSAIISEQSETMQFIIEESY